MNAVRAREAWEMDRLWKGRTIALENPQVVYAQSIGSGSVSTSSVNGDIHMSSTVHGSSRTLYKGPSPFSGQASSPIPPLPIIYSQNVSPGQSESSPVSSYLYPSSTGYRSYPDMSTLRSISSPESSPPPQQHHHHTPNPLPEPPRQSTYQPPPLPASLAAQDPTLAEYWSQYAGVAAYSH